ncbi:MAG: DUF3305 domain-containing protein [Granulosicoccus sp.]
MANAKIRSQLIDARQQGSTIRLSLPVTVLLERRLIKRKFWSLPSWTLAGVAFGEQLAHAGADGRKVRETEAGQIWSWSGYHITLYKDACERYWHALIGDKPKVYVICREDIDTNDVPLEPLLVTVDYDEATAYAETDELVLSASIPAELYRYMEGFVLEHYQPEPFRKRKRRDWSEEGRARGECSNGPEGDRSGRWLV